MSMFSGLTNQISGWVANKQGKNEGEAPVPPENGGGEDPLAQQQQQAGAMGEAGVEGGEAPNAAGRVTGMAQGFLSKAMAAKDGMKEKVGGFQPPNLHGLGNNIMSGVTNLIPGRKEEEVPTPPEPNPPTDMGGEMMEGGEEIVQE
ncbi:uncharacterized protein [Lepeophtheirus salmonis]|uniref:Uncharacterized protein n=1 Tax=Lepeophtheirus salmonis TaxID=72036 RepID=A0A0K2VF08_LEPSM|nr:uncharacterized protein LOC121131975 [Lepeophtheirus salmonis]XP_040583327.1 uncharacterized protein LOC121131975 [Lepeophtheirus salmonis]XP_040583328.1 uncharacterized protein LOC121131975 [Lepeophtheirus salmonis]XP_040583329.1 uncharacterized protein LOC121131975 [Lepeophtheirus salmonis]